MTSCYHVLVVYAYTRNDVWMLSAALVGLSVHPPEPSILFLSCVSARQTLSREAQPKNVAAAQGTNKQC